MKAAPHTAFTKWLRDITRDAAFPKHSRQARDLLARREHSSQHKSFPRLAQFNLLTTSERRLQQLPLHQPAIQAQLLNLAQHHPETLSNPHILTETAILFFYYLLQTSKYYQKHRLIYLAVLICDSQFNYHVFQHLSSVRQQHGPTEQSRQEQGLAAREEGCQQGA
jgi:hypothetical protein